MFSVKYKISNVMITLIKKNYGYYLDLNINTYLLIDETYYKLNLNIVN